MDAKDAVAILFRLSLMLLMSADRSTQVLSPFLPLSPSPPSPHSTQLLDGWSDTSAAAYDSWTCRLQTWSHLPMWDPVFAQSCMKREFYMHASSPAGNIGLERTVDCGKRGNVVPMLSSDAVWGLYAAIMLRM